MGSVYRAMQESLARPVAVKLIDVRKDTVEEGDFEARFLREASSLARLKHPNTVRVIDFGVWEGRSYLVMEYIQGQTLRSALKKRQLTTGQIMRVGSQIAGALAEAHSLGIVHRDLKPSNIMIRRGMDGEPEPVVIDFGLVKQLEEEDNRNGPGPLLGTPQYMSPEAIRGHQVDGRSDIFGLGVLMYKAITGVRAFPTGTTAEVLAAVVSQPVRAFADVNPELRLPPCVEQVIMAMLEKSPARRPRSMSQVRRGMEACLTAMSEPSLSDIALPLHNGEFMVPEMIDMPSSIVSSRIIVVPPPPKWHSARFAWGVAALSTGLAVAMFIYTLRAQGVMGAADAVPSTAAIEHSMP